MLGPVALTGAQALTIGRASSPFLFISDAWFHRFRSTIQFNLDLGKGMLVPWTLAVLPPLALIGASFYMHSLQDMYSPTFRSGVQCTSLLSLMKVCAVFGPSRSNKSIFFHLKVCKIRHFAQEYSVNYGAMKDCLGCSLCRIIISLHAHQVMCADRINGRNKFTGLEEQRGPSAIKAYTIVNLVK